MFQPIFRKIFWKEFRTFWPFWIAVFLLVNTLYVAFYSRTMNGIDTQKVLGLSIFMSILYACGCSASSFAWELENGTFSRLRSLPATAWQVGVPKLTWSITSSFALLLTLCLFGLPFCSGMNLTETALLKILIIYVPVILEGIAWGTLFSTFTRQPMLATIFTGIMTFGSNAIWGSIRIALPNEAPLSGTFVLLVVRLCVFLPVAGFAVYRMARWFDYWRFIENRNHADSFFEANSSLQPYDFYTTTDTRFVALLKHHYRQNRSLIWVLIPTFFAAAISLVVYALFRKNPDKSIDASDTIAVFSWLVIVCTIIASNIFSGDQRQSEFRFFAHRGVSLRAVWFSRILFTTILFGVLWTSMLIVAWFNWKPDLTREFGIEGSLHYLLYGCFVVGPVLLAAGAICSMLAKSRLLAWFGTVGLITVCVTLQILLLEYELSLLLLLPVVGLFLSSYLHLSDWIRERSGWKTRLRWLGPLATSLVLMVIVVATQRCSQIPRAEIPAEWYADYQTNWKSHESLQQLMHEHPALSTLPLRTVDLDSSPAWFAEKLEPTEETGLDANSSTEKIFNELFHKPAREQLSPIHPNRIYVFKEPQLDALLYIANMPIDWSTMYPPNRMITEELTELGPMLVMTAEYYLRKKEHRKSLECLMAAIHLTPPNRKRFLMAQVVFDILPQWAADEQVTPELIREAIAQISEVAWIAQDYERSLMNFSTDGQWYVAGYNDPDLLESQDCCWRLQFFPWEQARATRAIELVTFMARWQFDAAWQTLESEYPAKSYENFSDVQCPPYVPDHNSVSFGYGCEYFVGRDVPHATRLAAWMELSRRLALTSLSIRGWQLQHEGRLPNSLNQVAKTWEEAEQKEPLLKQPFIYYPEGFAQPESTWRPRVAYNTTINKSSYAYKRDSFTVIDKTPCLAFVCTTQLLSQSPFSASEQDKKLSGSYPLALYHQTDKTADPTNVSETAKQDVVSTSPN